MNSIFVSRSGDGHLNLATDEYLLEQYRLGRMEGVTLFFYVNSGDVIIGRNQSAWRECDVDRMRRDGVRLVRRHTGGGAVYHDEGNLNFSFITDELLYDKQRLNAVVLRAVRSLGVPAEVSGRNDFTFEGRKFSGCAYGLSGRARAMHGTLLVNTDFGRLSEYLKPSRMKLEAKGISSVKARVVNLSEAAEVSVDRAREAIAREFIREFGEAELLTLSDEAKEAVGRLYEKQRSWEWIFGRTPDFDISFEERLSFGEIQLHLRLHGGVVTEAAVFTDALDVGIADEIASLVTGCRFGKKALAGALNKGGAEARELARRLNETEYGYDE
ncbi:MAG: lipoate--protein ligase [Clostridia bacterium]|nr:lipoate--protein ligase [Clostridia bacterium]